MNLTSTFLILRLNLSGTIIATAMQISSLKLQADSLGHHFGHRSIFKDITFEMVSGQSIVFTGPNGSGKSTIIRAVIGLLTPATGAVKVSLGSRSLGRFETRLLCGYVAPDLMLYVDMTGVENLEFFASLKGVEMNREALKYSLERVGLLGRGRDLVREYSSGMRQRLKYAVALLGDPPILALDEPTANLDSSGTELVESLVLEWQFKGILLIGTNEENERVWGDHVVYLGGKTEN